MGKATAFLMALAVALTVVAFADAAPPGGLRRSRFLAAKLPPPISYNNCEKKPKVCEELESPGNSCCNVCTHKEKNKQNCHRCVNTHKNVAHCGVCGNMCAYGETCCDGKCVDLINDRKNCGECGFKCLKNLGCSYGLCDYAG